MSRKEIKEINGGWWWIPIGLGLAILNTDWDVAINDFERGSAAAQK